MNDKWQSALKELKKTYDWSEIICSPKDYEYRKLMLLNKLALTLLTQIEEEKEHEE